MFFIILAIIITFILMCAPVAALYIANKSGVKIVRPMGLGIGAIIISSVISALVLLLYEDSGIALLQSDIAIAIRWVALGALEAVALFVVYNNFYKNKISFMEAICVSIGMCIPMLYSRGLSVAITHIQIAQQGISMAEGWELFYLTIPPVLMVFFQPVMAMFMVVELHQGKKLCSIAAYTLMTTLCYNMNDICTMLGAGTWLKMLIWLILLTAATMQVYCIRAHYAELPPIESKKNGAKTRMKDDKYAWPDDSAFYDDVKRKQIHGEAKRKK